MTDFRADAGICPWCGALHGPRCPTVKAIEYDCDGVTVKRIEFFAPNEHAPIGSHLPSSNQEKSADPMLREANRIW
jgi:hypothetical protein